MNRPNFYYFGLLLITATLIVQSCRKSENVLADYSIDDNGYYTASVKGELKDGTILAAPLKFDEDKGVLLIMDKEGNVLRSKKTEGKTFCFKKWDINGQVRYTYIVDDVNSYHLPNISQSTGYAVIADEDLNEIKRVNLLPYNTLTTNKGENLDVHDFILLSDDHYYTMAYYEKTVTNIPSGIPHDPNVKIVAPIIQEVQNGGVVWQWDGTDYSEFYDASVEGNDYMSTTVPQDYMHMNSMIIDPRDQNLILSFRHLDMIIKVGKTSKDIIWRLGGKNSDFPLSADQTFMRQHDATLINNNNTLLFFDNGHITDRPYSRVIEMTLDENGKSITGFFAYNINKPFAQYMGSVQKIDNHYFIGGGTGNYIMEINADNGEVLLDMDSEMSTYRAYKYQ